MLVEREHNMQRSRFIRCREFARSGKIERERREGGGAEQDFGEKFNCNNLDNSLHSTRVNRLSFFKYKQSICTRDAHTYCELHSAWCTNTRARTLFAEFGLASRTNTGCGGSAVPSVHRA